MTFSSGLLLDELISTTQSHLNRAIELHEMEDDTLNWKASQDSWSVLECLEHLNLYGDFYLPTIDKSISNCKYPPKGLFKSGILGNYFAKSMLPEGKRNKMKTFKDKYPSGSMLKKNTIHKFIDQQQEMISLLNRAKSINISKAKTSITIASWLKLKLGDTFRFVINHNTRHMQQIEDTLNQQK